MGTSHACAIGTNGVPTIESSETRFDTLGFSTRAYTDIGLSYGAPEGIVKASGTAR